METGERFLGASDFLESLATFRKWLGVDRSRVDPPLVFLSFFSSFSFLFPFFPFISVSLPFRLNLRLSTQTRRDAARHRHAYKRFSVCMFCGWLFVQTVDTRRKVIISLSHLIISANYSPEYSLRPALTSVHGYRRGCGCSVPSALPTRRLRTHPPFSLAVSYGLRPSRPLLLASPPPAP